MELRSFNVERVYKECVICRVGDDLGVKKEALEGHRYNIVDMLKQLATFKGKTPLVTANIRKDGETWTPYLQIVEMLILLGKKIGMVDYEGKLNKETLITIKDFSL